MSKAARYANILATKRFIWGKENALSSGENVLTAFFKSALKLSETHVYIDISSLVAKGTDTFTTFIQMHLYIDSCLQTIFLRFNTCL